MTPAEQVRQYPRIPGKPYNSKMSEVGVRDFTVFPPKEGAVKYPLFVPRLDRDGNPTAGIILPEIAAPVATLSGKAVRGKGFAEGELCGGERLDAALSPGRKRSGSQAATPVSHSKSATRASASARRNTGAPSRSSSPTATCCRRTAPG